MGEAKRRQQVNNTAYGIPRYMPSPNGNDFEPGTHLDLFYRLVYGFYPPERWGNQPLTIDSYFLHIAWICNMYTEKAINHPMRKHHPTGESLYEWFIERYELYHHAFVTAIT